MYIKKITLENVGPISNLEIELPFHENDKPKPIVLVGENWVGKSILLSYIVNSLILLRQASWISNTETENWKVYKLRSPQYIKIWQEFLYCSIEFDEQLELHEWQFNSIKSKLPVNLQSELNSRPHFQEVPETESSLVYTNFEVNLTITKEIESQNVLLYFPSSRFEEPAWLNEINLQAKANYQDLKNIGWISNRKIVVQNNLLEIKNWLFDVIFDHHLYVKQGVATFSVIYDMVTQLLWIILSHKFSNPNFRFGSRKDRVISIYDWEVEVAKNIFTLSTWETLLLILSMWILRDFDLTNNPQDGWTKNIKWIVVIDEIDLHLHSTLQKEVLPKIVKYFPKIQFIITTHSPLFVLWMEQSFWTENIEIREMPSWNIISAERFREFETAYSYFKETITFEEEIQKQMTESKKPVIFVEWPTDVRYIEKAASVLWKEEIIKWFDLQIIGENTPDWTKHSNDAALFAAEIFLSTNLNLLDNKIVILHDPENNIKKKEYENKLFIRKMESHSRKLIEKWIESLFSSEFMEKARWINKRCFKKVTIEDWEIENAKIEVKQGQKNELCSWICTNGKIEDFSQFQSIFDELESILNI